MGQGVWETDACLSLGIPEDTGFRNYEVNSPRILQRATVEGSEKEMGYMFRGLRQAHQLGKRHW
jgi:hypothetical protein